MCPLSRAADDLPSELRRIDELLLRDESAVDLALTHRLGRVTPTQQVLVEPLAERRVDLIVGITEEELRVFRGRPRRSAELAVERPEEERLVEHVVSGQQEQGVVNRTVGRHICGAFDQSFHLDLLADLPQL